MGLFNFLERQAGDSKVGTDWTKLGKAGYSNYDYGRGITQEGLGGLRSLDSTLSGRLSDPLGEQGRGIFARARAGLQDDYTREVNSGAASAAQLARQSGGALTPEQVAALDAQNRRDASQGLFEGTGNIANAEATATLTETGKLFDRLENIRQSILGLGQNEEAQGLKSIIASLMGRTDRMKSIWSDVTSAGNAAGAAGYGGK